MEPKAKTEVAQWPDSFEQALPIGTEMLGDQFTITEHLGAGGFGITYRALDNALGREIVIKECFFEDHCYREGKNVLPLRPALEKTIRSIIKMFMREARILAKLRHPNIVGVHRVFEENGTAYMVLDLIEGKDLYDYLETSPQPDQVKRLLMQLLDAIEQVHGHGLLHRDISPDNILVEPSGNPVLIDFGAAKSDANRRTRKATSMMVVKDGYSPYEFYEAGSKQTESSDLYALGATFYHLLTGEPPANSQARLLEIAGKQPDPSPPLAGRIMGYEESFLAAIDKAMEIHPKDRMQSAAQWREMISARLTEIPRPFSSPISRPNSVPKKLVQELDVELERRLSKLVEETNEQVKGKSKPRSKDKPATTKPKSQPKPAWIDEFNEETIARQDAKSISEPLEPDETTGVESSVGQVAVGPAKQEVNWIERALEKQERERLERERELEERQREAEAAEELAAAELRATARPNRTMRIYAGLVLTVGLTFLVTIL